MNNCNAVRSDIESIFDTPVKDAEQEEVDGTYLISSRQRSSTTSNSTKTQKDLSEDQWKNST